MFKRMKLLNNKEDAEVWTNALMSMTWEFWYNEVCNITAQMRVGKRMGVKRKKKFIWGGGGSEWAGLWFRTHNLEFNGPNRE